jgi:hypothetical protein
MPLLNTADAVYLGGQAVDAVYLGADKVWEQVGGFSPADLAGLTIWLDASQLGLADGAGVSPWPNLGSGIDAAIVGAPAPVVADAALNGLPVVRFTAGQGRVRSSGTGAGEAGLNWTVAYVARLRDGTIGRVVNANYPPANLLIGFWNGFENVAFVEGFLAPDARRAQTTDWRLYSASGEGASGNAKAWFYEDGVFQSGDHAVGGGWQDSFNISGYSATGVEEMPNCDVAEVLFYDHRLSDAERVQAEDYLREKWGLG